MTPERNIARTITIRKVEQDENRFGCTPTGVQVQFVESQTIPGNANMDYLIRLFRGKGFQTREAAPLPDIPFLRLCIFRDGGPQVNVDEVLAILHQDQEIDLSQMKELREGPA